MKICDKCGEEIIWVRTPAGRMMPCNPGLHEYWAEPGGRGRVVVFAGYTPAGTVAPRGMVLACVWKGSGPPSGTGYVPHWAACGKKSAKDSHGAEQLRIF